MKYADAPAIASKAAEIIPAVDDSAIEIVSLRALSLAAIRSAWGSKSCNIAPPPLRWPAFAAGGSRPGRLADDRCAEDLAGKKRGRHLGAPASLQTCRSIF